jgi:multidrug resistance efflux pump
MRPALLQISRVVVTCLLLTLAAVASRQLWVYYMEDPWTRDGTVAADVVAVAPDVSGLVTEVLVRDNEPVHSGRVLFRIDTERFRLALQQADAVVDERHAAMVQAGRNAIRYAQLNEIAVSREQREQMITNAQTAGAQYQQAVADRAVAALNLARSEVKSPVNGIVTNFNMQPGDYATAGHSVVSLVDTDTLHVEGYFEETKLHRIHVGNLATVHLMGDSTTLHGHVESVSAGVSYSDVSSSGALAAVNPVFTWVRLPQRVPVRVALDHVPPGTRLVVGRTATVAVVTPAVAPG